MKEGTVPRLFADVVKSHASKPAYLYEANGGWAELTWSEIQARVEQVVRGLIALGVNPGDRVGILARTRIEWILADFGIGQAAGVTVGVYQSCVPDEVGYVLDHCEAEVIFVEDAEQLAKVDEVRAQLPRIRHIVILDGASDPDRGLLAWDDFLELGADLPAAQLQERADAIDPDDLASLVYTSGTTGVPKGVMITHRNLTAVSKSSSQAIHMKGDYQTLLFLPLAHVFARLMVYCCMRRGVSTAVAKDLTAVPKHLQEIRPHFFAGVPRIYEKVYDKVLSGVEAAGGLKARIFHWALGVGQRVSRLQQDGKPIPALLGLQHKLADRLALHKVRAFFGGRLVFAISGAAPLNTTTAEFFHACGVLLLEGIGQTENTSFTHVNRIEQNRFGTVGLPGPGVEVRIAEDGEVLFRGPTIMKGYYKNPEATAETIDSDGWLHSGDIGEIDEDNFLKITDRKKDLIVTSGGKNVAPQRLERIMRTSRFIGQAVAYGDRRKFITALVTLDPENIREWASQQPNGIAAKSEDELARDERIRSLIQSEIEERNRQLASYETVKKFHILPRDFTIESGELTPTMKLKRKVVVDRYRGELDALYE